MVNKLLSSVLALALGMSSACVFAKSNMQNLLCLSPPDSNGETVIVYLDAEHKTLLVDDDLHHIAYSRKTADATMLYTRDYTNLENKRVYLAFISINAGKYAGMYMVQYIGGTSDPTHAITLECRHYLWGKKTWSA